MSNENFWLKTLDDFQTIVDSARYSIPMEEMFEDESVYLPIREAISDFDLASWLMFDTLENRQTTTNLIHQFWHHLHKLRGVGPFLDRIFDSYLSIYRVNYVSEKGLYIQNLAFRRHAILLKKTETTKVLKEGDVFFGRIIFTDVGNFAFYITNIVPEDLSESFIERVENLMALQPMLSNDPAAYEESLKEGNPDLMFLYALSLDRAREDQQESLYFDWTDEDDMEEDAGIYRFAVHFSDESDDNLTDIYAIEAMESKLYLDKGKSFDDLTFTDYEGLLEAASIEGVFSNDDQMLRIVAILKAWTDEMGNEAGLKSLLAAEERLLFYKANLEQSVGGMYRSRDFDQVLLKSEERHLPWISRYDRYLESFIHHSMEATKTGALNRNSLDLVLPVIGVMTDNSEGRIIEGRYPELVLYRKFAELKGLIALEGDHFEVTTRMEHYMQLTQGEKLSLWLTTLLHPRLAEVDPYFKNWNVGELWAKLLDRQFIEQLISKISPSTTQEKIDALAAQMGQDLLLYRISFNGGYFLDLSAMGVRVLEHLGVHGRDNIVTLYGNDRSSS